MSLESGMSQEVADRQVAMFAMFVGPSLYTNRAALSRASRVPESSLREYAKGAAMPLHVVLTLRRYLPPEAINMLTEPGGARLVSIEASKANWDAIGCTAAGLVSEICQARADGIIDHQEDAQLRRRTRALIAEAADLCSDG
jgi:hypothetical protein